MAVWKLYAYDESVPCRACGKPVGVARDGEVIGFGDGNGNRFFKCACGIHTSFDATRSAAAAHAHMLEYAARFAEENSLFAAQSVIPIPEERAGGEPAKPKIMRRAVHGGGRAVKPEAPVASMADFFDLGSMITAEVSKL